MKQHTARGNKGARERESAHDAFHYISRRACNIQVIPGPAAPHRVCKFSLLALECGRNLHAWVAAFADIVRSVILQTFTSVEQIQLNPCLKFAFNIPRIFSKPQIFLAGTKLFDLRPTVSVISDEIFAFCISMKTKVYDRHSRLSACGCESEGRRVHVNLSRFPACWIALAEIPRVVRACRTPRPTRWLSGRVKNERAATALSPQRSRRWSAADGLLA